MAVRENSKSWTKTKNGQYRQQKCPAQWFELRNWRIINLPKSSVYLIKLGEMKFSQSVKIACLLFTLATTNVLAAHAAITVAEVAKGCAASHSLFLKSDGSLWGMGPQNLGRLGDGTDFGNDSTNKPEEIVASNVVAVAAGATHSLFLKSDGSLWTMGFSEWGQLGLGTNWLAVKPMRVVSHGVVAIAAGDGFSLFLKSDGSLWGMGNNSLGQLGDGTFDNTNKPEKIVTWGVKAIAAGGGHSLFLKSDGSLWGMGDNSFGQLGDGTSSNNRNRPEEIVSPDGRCIAAERSHNHKSYNPHPRGRVVAIAAGGGFLGEGHSMFLKSDGSLWMMGANTRGQLGDGPFDGIRYMTNQPEQIVDSNVVAIAAGALHSLFLKSDGSLWAMGDGNNGQLGDGTLGAAWQPEKIIASGVTAIAAGWDHSLFLKSDGSLWGMGYDGAGTLGDGFWFDGISGVGPEQIWPRPQPVLTGVVSDNTNLQLTAPCGFGGDFCLLASTNLNQPNYLWTPIWTNTIRYRFANVFSATLTNEVNSGNQQFYILQSR